VRRLPRAFYRLTAGAAALAAIVALVVFPVLAVVALAMAVAAFLRSRQRDDKRPITKPKAPASVPEAARAPAASHPGKPDERLGVLAGLTRLSLNRKPVVFLAAGVIALLGAYSALDMKQELFPEIDLPAVTVVTRFPGASSESIVQQVTQPVEQGLSNVDGLERMQSTTAEGVSVVVAEFEFGTDTEEKQREISAAMERVQLPTGADEPSVNRIDFGDFPIVAITVYGGEDPAALETAVDQVVVPAISRIDGVFTVSVTGRDEQLLAVTLDPVRMSELGVTVNDVMLTLSGSGVSAPSGFVLEDGVMLPVRTVDPVTSPEELAHLVLVRAIPAPDAPSVRLGDFARVDRITSPTAAVARTNGEPSLSLGVFKTREGNTVQVANDTERALEEVRGQLPPGVEAEVLFDQSELIEESISSLVREGLLGAAFAVLIILLFLVSIRATVVTAVSIPLSMLAAIVFLHWQGVTLNIMTLGGLTIAVGRVVDDSIVVLENIYVHSRRGKPAFQAALDGTREVSTAILSSTLTTVAVFLPLAFIGGIVEESFLPLALAVTAALLASLVVALTVVPALSVIMMPAIKLHDGESWLQRIYTPVLRWSLGHRLATLGIAAAIFAGSFATVPFIDFSFLPNSGWDVVAGRVELPAGTPMQVTAQKAVEMEAALKEVPGIKNYQLIVGQTDVNNPGSFRGGIPGSNTIDVTLTYDDGVDLEAEAARARELFTSFDGVTANIRVIQPTFETDRVEVVVSGDSREAIAATAGDITAGLSGLDELENIDNDIVGSASEYVVDVDPEVAGRYGLTPAQLALEIRRLLVGVPVGNVQVSGEPLPVVMQVDSGGPATGGSLEQLRLALPGNPAIGEVADIHSAEGPAVVTRVDGRSAATVTATIMGTDLTGASNRVKDVVASVEKAPGTDVRIGGIFAQQEEAFSDLYLAMAIGVLIVYLVMVASLGSLANPLIVLFSLPFVSIGAFLALLFTGRDLGLPALMGFLMLIGIVVTNAIVLINFVEMLRERGMPANEALLEGARSRVRPILMTALATIFALVPLVLGLGAGIIIAAELATVVIGGLFTSTVLTLVVIPVLYSLYHDAPEWVRAASARAIRIMRRIPALGRASA
jgi:HAE1 family hydrophobic/amphiphilic exporter-1